MSLSTAAESAVSACLPVRLSFRDVYRSNYTYVWRSLLRLGVADATVDDAVQDVFIVVHRKLDDFEGRAAVRTWLFAIARRVAMRYRDRARRNAVDDEAEPETETSSVDRPDDALSRAEALRRLQFWLDELDDDKRAVFVLSEFEQMRAPEIADTLGVNLNTVYARLRAARLHVTRRARRHENLEGYRPLLRHHSSARKPSTAQRRHAWLVLSGKLGLAKTAVVTGTGLASGGLLTKLAVAASLVGGGTLAATAISGPAKDPAPVVASIGAVDTSDAPAKRRGTASRIVEEEEPSEHPLMVPPQPADAQTPDPVELAPSLQRRLDGAKVGRAGAKAPTNAPKATATVLSEASKPDPFATELTLFEQAKVAARRGETSRALALLARYKSEFPRGSFSIEAAALKVRTLCSGGRTDAARKEASAFGKRHPASKLVDPENPCG